MTTGTDRWLSTKEAAGILGVSPHTLRTYLTRGQIDVRVRREEIIGMVRLHWHADDIEARRVARGTEQR